MLRTLGAKHACGDWNTTVELLLSRRAAPANCSTARPASRYVGSLFFDMLGAKSWQAPVDVPTTQQTLGQLQQGVVPVGLARILSFVAAHAIRMTPASGANSSAQLLTKTRKVRQSWESCSAAKWQAQRKGSRTGAPKHVTHWSPASDRWPVGY